jgi:hypothetical protein
MGITVRHRRIPADLLAKFLEQQDEQRVIEYIYEGDGPFPYTLQHYALGEYWPLLRDFLQSDERQSPFWRTLHGSQPIIPFYGAADQEYLGVVDYVTPEEVRRITQAMSEITLEQGIRRYMTWRNIEDEMVVWDEDPRDYTSFHFVWQQFLDFFCFFHIAEEAGDGILQEYSD